MSEYETELIIKKLNQTLSKEESEELAHWINASSENQRIEDKWTKLWHMMEDPSANFHPHTEPAWLKVKRRMLEEQSAPSQKSSARTYDLWMKIAASLLLVISVGWSLNHFLFEDSSAIVYTNGEDTQEIVLSDHTHVTLGKHSMLSVEPSFGDSIRLVKLKGQAFFDVTKDAKHPFRIALSDAQITVLGTSFDVYSDAMRNRHEVEVYTGKVLFENTLSSNNRRLLLPGDKAVMDNHEIISAARMVKRVTSDTLTFHNSKLSTVIAQLEEHFKTTIVFQNPNIKECTYTGSFDHSSLTDILEVLTASMDLTFEEKQGTYFLKGNSCP